MARKYWHAQCLTTKYYQVFVWLFFLCMFLQLFGNIMMRVINLSSRERKTVLLAKKARETEKKKSTKWIMWHWLEFACWSAVEQITNFTLAAKYGHIYIYYIYTDIYYTLAAIVKVSLALEHNFRWMNTMRECDTNVRLKLVIDSKKMNETDTETTIPECTADYIGKMNHFRAFLKIILMIFLPRCLCVCVSQTLVDTYGLSLRAV